MKGFNYLISNLLNEVNNDTDVEIKKAILEFKQILKNEKIIRIFVAGSNGSGHQTTTIHIMMRIIYVFCYSGNIEVYYEEKEKADKSTKEKLIQLIQGLSDKNFDQGIKIGYKNNKTMVNFIEYNPNDKPLQKINYGFTGGADDDKENYAIKLNVSQFLRLQPLNWKNAPNQIEFINGNKVEFDSLVESPYYYGISKLDDEDFDVMLKATEVGTKERTKLEHAKNLYKELEKGDKSNIYLLPIYGIRDDGKMQLNDIKNPAKYIYVLLLAMVKLIENKKNNNKKIVVISFGEIEEKTVNNIESGCKEYIEKEKGYLLSKKINSCIKSIKKKYNTGINMYDEFIKNNEKKLEKIDCVYVDKDTPIERQKLDDIDKVLFLQLASVPTSVFNYFYSNTNFASIFEGQGTATKAICYGKPYLQLGKVLNIDKYHYSNKYIKGRKYIISALDGIINTFPTSYEIEYKDINKNYIDNKINNIFEFMLQIIDDQKTDVKDYIRFIQEEYGKEKHDKLLRGIIELRKQDQSIMSSDRTRNELVKLLENIEEKSLDKTKIDIIDILPDGDMKTFYRNVVNRPEYYIEDITITKHYNDEHKLVSIIITGVTTFFGVKVNVDSLKFTCVPAGLHSIGEYSCLTDDNWDITGAEWIVLTKPRFKLEVFNYKKPVYLVIFGKLESLGIELSLEYSNNNQWNIKGNFSRPYITISRICQIIGGININNYLPEIIISLVNLGVEQINIQYDSVNKRINDIRISIRPNNDIFVKLLSNIYLKDLWIDAIVFDPIDMDNRRIEAYIGGAIDIGGGIMTIKGTYPEYMINGNLTSGKIDINKIINIFLPNASIDIKTSIDQMSLYLDIKKMNYGLNITLDTDWQIIIANKPIFSITNLCLTVEGTKKQIPSVVMSGSVYINQSKLEKVRINMSASYETDKERWIIKGSSEGVFSLASMLSYYTKENITIDSDIQIKDIMLEIDKYKEFTFFQCSSKTAYKWKAFADIYLDATVEFGYRRKSNRLYYGDKHLINNEVIINNNIGEWYGKIFCTTKWQNIDIIIGSEYSIEKKEWNIWFEWKSFTGLIKKIKVNNDYHWIGTLGITNLSLGNMIEEMISWATGHRFGLSEPWDIINNISLDNFQLEYDFTIKKVSFNIIFKPIELGLAKIYGIRVSYNPDDKSVIVELKGSFRWMSEPDSPLSWDATDPDNAPAPPGKGNKYIDLRMLALGQHISITGLNKVDKVKDAIEIIRELPELRDGQLPIGEQGQPFFDDNSSWLVAADFGIMKIEGNEKDKAEYVVQLSSIFHDSDLYALRIALAGDAAKVLKGLEFEIMYKKINDTIGCYSSEIKLPDTIRNISIGAYTITLPILVIEIYTNGDFKIDVGFPWNFDFTRSFTLQGIVMVGPIPVPLIGSAGFYFGRLSKDTCKDVPMTSLGNFNPIHVFGIGIQFGLGKYIEKGIFKAGLSITVAGILEGIIAKFNPIKLDTSRNSSSTQLQGEYYFLMKGTVGIIGKLFGLVDFSIVKASVDVDLSITAGLTLESYADIPITIHASVDVALKISINCGLFKVHVHFSFSMRLKETFIIKTDAGKPPWYEPELSNISDYHKKQIKRLKNSTLRKMYYEEVDQSPLIINWSNLEDAQTTTYMKSYIVLSLTVTMKEETKDVEAHYIPLMFLETLPEKSLCQGIENKDEMTSFEKLCIYILKWVISLGLSKKCTLDEIDNYIISSEYINKIQQYLTGTHDSKEILKPQDVEDFIRNQKLVFKIQTPSSLNKVEEGAIFPMPRKLGLNIKSNNNETKYTFEDFSKIDNTYIKGLRDYFDKLSVIVSEENKKNIVNKTNKEQNSLVGFVFADYFLLIARQMIQATLDSLRNYKMPIDDTKSINDIIEWINSNGEFNESDKYSVEELLEGNENHLLNPNKKIKLTGVKHVIEDNQTINSITNEIYKGVFSEIELININKDKAGILIPKAVIRYKSNEIVKEYEITRLDTINSIAENITQGNLNQLINISDITNRNIFKGFTHLTLPEFIYNTVLGDCLETINNKFNVRIDNHIDNLRIKGLFKKGIDNKGYINIIHLNKFRTKEIINEIHRTGVIKHLSGIVSRYLLHGLRLPTTMDNGGSIKLLDKKIKEGEYSLYKLMGQYINIKEEDYSMNESYSIDITKTKELDWIEFDNSPTKQYMTIELDKNDRNAISSVICYGREEGFKPAQCSLGISSMIKYEPLMAPFSSMTLLNSKNGVHLPYGIKCNDSTQLKIWHIPQSLMNLSKKKNVLPKFDIVIGTFDEATSVLNSRVCNCYGFGTRIDIGIRRSPISLSGETAKYTYELMGCSENDIILLERIVGYIKDKDNYIDSLKFLYSFPSTQNEDEALMASDSRYISYFISQVNLTTITRPPKRNKNLSENTKCQSNINFIRQLWENSITRSGGYYLYYYDGYNHRGFEDYIFNDRGEGKITLLIMYSKIPEQDGLTNYMNCVITGDSIDHNRSVIYAKAKSVNTPIDPRGKSLIDIADNYYTYPSKLAEDNAAISLNNKNKLVINKGIYCIKTNGPIDVQDICNYFDIKLENLKKANKEVINWSNLLIGQVIRLPKITIKIGSSKGGITLASLADFYGVSVSDIANDNKQVKDIFCDTINIINGPYSINNSVPAGAVTIEAKRQVPEDIPDMPNSDKDYNYGRLYLEHMYNLLGFKIKDNDYFSKNLLSLPMGPTIKTNSKDRHDKIRMPLSVCRQGELWQYQQSIPYYKFSKTNNNSLSFINDIENPYLGIGDLLEIEYYWVDIFGNKIKSNMDTSEIIFDTSITPIPCVIGYHDKLIPLSMWQGVSYRYAITKEKGLSIILTFDSSSFLAPLMELNILNAKSIYEKLIYQIKTCKGNIRFYIQSNLLDIGLIPLEKTNILCNDKSITSIYKWIEKIYIFLYNLTKGITSDITEELTIYYPFKEHEINKDSLCYLNVNFIVERDKKYIDSHFQDVKDVSKVITSIRPRIDNKDDSVVYSLKKFAEDFEEALNNKGEYITKLATGVSRDETNHIDKLWAIRIGDNNYKGLNYEIINKAKPVFFAPKPISNQLESRCDVPIYDYTTGEVINFNKANRRLSFTDIDIDVWMKIYLTAIDDFLSPQYISTLGILTMYNEIDYLGELKKIKQKLAKSLSKMLYPIYGKCQGGIQEANKKFEQQLLQKLLSFYDTKAMVQFKVLIPDSVINSCNNPVQLYGTLKNNVDDSNNIMISDAKLNLAKDMANPISYLTFSIENADEKINDKMIKSILVDLDYQVTNIEHEIGELPGIEGYKASSWLSYVLKKDNRRLLDRSLGKFEIPLVYRGYPTPLSMLNQYNMHRYEETDDIRELCKWDYAFEYINDYHYTQDITYFQIKYNIPREYSINNNIEDRDLIDTLAEFITVYEPVSNDLSDYLNRVCQDDCDKDLMEKAIKATESFILLVDDVSKAWESEKYTTLSERDYIDNNCYKFYIKESSINMTNDDKIKVKALKITIVEEIKQAYINKPIVEINGYKTVEIDEDEYTNYVFKSINTGKYLTLEEGLSISKRIIRIPDINILSVQNAITGSYIIRNRELIEGRITNEEFIYRTPVVSFNNPYFPKIDRWNILNIATIENGEPKNKTLKEHLINMIKCISQEDKDNLTLQIECKYSYSINTNLKPIELPILFIPAKEYKLDSIISELADNILEWFMKNRPNKDRGTFWFDLMIMSNLTNSLKPLLRLKQLKLEVEYIEEIK